ncbi:flagellar motor protein MotB [Burkholderia sp. WAC0059]|nr:flagellar motor protein MotB [Burkholderia sp. WAC0059]
MSFLAGCSSWSGPLQNSASVTLSGNVKAWRVQCAGLFESSETCMTRAREICGKQPVQVVSSAQPSVVGGLREYTFQCGVPAQPQPQPPQAQPQPQPPRAEVPRQLALSGNAHFATGKADLTSDATAVLDRLVVASVGAVPVVVKIDGYTDSTGPAELNRRLSLARARSVQSWFVAHGLSAQQYEIKGFGSANPVASNATPAGRAENRRVEVSINGRN